MHTIGHLHIHNDIKTVKFLRVLKLIFSSSGITSNGCLQNMSNYFLRSWSLISYIKM